MNIKLLQAYLEAIAADSNHTIDISFARRQKPDSRLSSCRRS